MPAIDADTAAKHCKLDPKTCGCKGSARLCLKEWNPGDSYHPFCHKVFDEQAEKAFNAVNDLLTKEHGYGVYDGQINIHNGTFFHLFRGNSECEILVAVRPRGSPRRERF